MTLDPFFPFFGSKTTLVGRRCYPAPRYPRIIEPFAGSACYSLRYHTRNVVLVERDPIIAELWRWLLRVTSEEVLALPDIRPGQSTDDLEVCPAAQSLIGFWCNPGAATPRKARSSWSSNESTADGRLKPRLYWGSRVRHRVARQLEAIRHWTIMELAPGPHNGVSLWLPGIWRGAPATWFIDPPYQGRPGSHYRFGSGLIDYAELGEWCQTLPGQVIVCEQAGADWLPFEPVGVVDGQRGKSREVAWFSCQEDRPSYGQPELFS